MQQLRKLKLMCEASQSKFLARPVLLAESTYDTEDSLATDGTPSC